jgi:hypothetical protein
VVCDPFDFYKDLHTFLHSLKSEKFISDAHDDLVTWVSDIPAAMQAFKLSIKPPNLI